jgi:uncharacterized membrane protein YoaK (UPF0700 family)
VFDSFGGLPLHPLVIHVVVLAIPVTLLLSLAFAVPRLRAWARWPLAVASVGSIVATLVARESGQALRTVLGITPQSGPVGALIAEHAERANQLVWMTAVMAVLGVLAAVLVDRPAEAPSSGGRRALSLGLLGALVVVAALASFWSYRVGDLGARAVWNPVGQTNYSGGE